MASRAAAVRLFKCKIMACKKKTFGQLCNDHEDCKQCQGCFKFFTQSTLNKYKGIHCSRCAFDVKVIAMHKEYETKENMAEIIVC